MGHGAVTHIGRAILRAPAFLLIVLAAQACSWFGPDEREIAEEQRFCPRVGALGEANHITKFRRGGGDARDVLFEADILRVRSMCEFDDDDIEVYLDIAVDMEFLRGPAQLSKDFTTEYFIAVSARNGRVYDRQTFPIEAEFEGVQTRGALTEILEYAVVVPEGLKAADLVLYIGFVLTPREVRFNRQRRRG